MKNMDWKTRKGGEKENDKSRKVLGQRVLSPGLLAFSRRCPDPVVFSCGLTPDLHLSFVLVPATPIPEELREYFGWVERS